VQPHSKTAVTAGGVHFLPSLSTSITILGNSPALELFENTDLEHLGRLEFFVDYWLQPAIPAYSLEELTQHLWDVRGHWERFRPTLISSGIPAHPFSASDWLQWRIGNLYPVKCPARYPWITKAALSEYTECTWFREVPLEIGNAGRKSGDLLIDGPLLGVFSTTAQKADLELFTNSVTLCEYDAAPLLPWLNREAAEWVERELRPKFFVAKLSVIDRLEEALAGRSHRDVWESCAAILSRALSSHDAKMANELDVAFSLATPDCYGLTAFRGSSGGLARVVEFIGYCEKELVIGTLVRLHDQPRARFSREREITGRSVTRERFADSETRKACVTSPTFLEHEVRTLRQTPHERTDQSGKDQ
jgi:hypothetical protein